MDMILQGNLAHFRPYEILDLLARSGRTGTLRFVHGGKETFIYIDGGSVAFARSNQEQMRMPAVLARLQKITSAQRVKLEELQGQEHDRFAQTAVKKNLFTADEMRDLFSAYVLEILADSHDWDGGNFFLTDSLQLPEFSVPVSLTLDQITEETEKRARAMEEAAQIFPDPHVRLSVVGDPEADNITLSIQEFKLLLKIKEMKSPTVEQIVEGSGKARLEVYQTLDRLKGANLLEEIGRGEAPTPALGTPAPPPPPQPAASPAAEQREENWQAQMSRPAPEPVPFVEDKPTQETAQLAREEKAQATPPPQAAPPQPPPQPPPPPPVAAAEPPTPPAATPQSPSEEQPSGEFSMAVLTIDNAERTSFPLYEDDYSVGREPGNQVQVPDGSVSASHARLVRRPEGYILEDLNSRNGTYVNGERIQSRLLKDNDRIRLGKVHMIYSIPSEMEPSTATVFEQPRPN